MYSTAFWCLIVLYCIFGVIAQPLLLLSFYERGNSGSPPRSTKGLHRLRHDRPSGWFSKSRGLSASVSFLSSSPPPPPLFYLRHLSRGQFDSRSSFFAPKLHRNACYAGYVSLGRLCLKMQIQGNPKFNPFSRIRRFSSSKNINSFFRNLQRFQTLPRVSSRPLNKV